MFRIFNWPFIVCIPIVFVTSSVLVLAAPDAGQGRSTLSHVTLLQADFDKALVGHVGNAQQIDTIYPTGAALNTRLSESDKQAVTIVKQGDGNHVLSFTDNSTAANFPRVYQTLKSISSDAKGHNEVRITFDLTPLPIEGRRPSVRMLLNASSSQTSSGNITALQISVGDRGGKPVVRYQDGNRGATGAILTPGMSYRFTIVANFGSATQDLYSLHVAPTDDLDHPVMDLNGISTRAANITPDMIVFDGGEDAKAVNAAAFVEIDNIMITAGSHTRPVAASVPENTLWQIGFEDSCLDEFEQTSLAAYTVPANWKTRSDWSGFARQILRADKPTLDLTYTLASIPEHGVEFDFRSMRTAYTTPELAVYSNSQFAGQIQTRGTRFFRTCYGDFRDVYRLYIPAEMLKVGKNVLRLETPRMPYVTSDAADWTCLIGWDYLRLRALQSPAMEPTHGRVVYAGTIFMQNDTQLLSHDIVRCIQPVSEWLGIAYSGNTMRANFWKNRTSQQPARMAILQKYRDLNMTVAVDYISGHHAKPLMANGTLDPKDQTELADFFETYGNLLHFYEISNEPCLIGKESLAKEIALAKYINQIKPSHLKTAAPGYAFAKTGGDPDGWAASPIHRRELEQYCDVLGGHSYGTNFGAFMHLMDAYGPTLNNGFPKDFMITEHGSVQSYHRDLPNVKIGSTQPHAAAFDRNLRNLIAVGDQFMYHAPYFLEAHANGDMNFFDRVNDWTTFDPMDTKAYHGIGDQENRVKTYRRLVLAYATHGQPLKYELRNAHGLAFKRVYVRPVNTAGLAPLSGSGAKSNKVLLNFVNFEQDTQTVTARIYLPSDGSWSGVRIGAGEVLREARSDVSMNALPYVDITETLDARESVQYILEPDTQ